MRHMPSLSISGAAIVSLLSALVLATGCHAEASVKASSDANEPRSDFQAASTPGPAPQAVTAPAPPPPPRTDACPLLCFEPQGSLRVPVTTEELNQLRTALEPTLNRMHTCTSEDDWRRHGSPVINLRIAPDGTLSEIGVDPHHGLNSSCFDEVGRGANLSLSLPTRQIVRCSERCGRDVRVVQGVPEGRRNRGRGRAR